MKRSILIVIAAASALVGFSQNAQAALHSNKAVGLILQASGDNCYYFQLVGVTETDPSVSTSPLFAISRSDSAAKDMLAVLMAVKASVEPSR